MLQQTAECKYTLRDYEKGTIEPVIQHKNSCMRCFMLREKLFETAFPAKKCFVGVKIGDIVQFLEESDIPVEITVIKNYKSENNRHM